MTKLKKIDEKYDLFNNKNKIIIDLTKLNEN